MKKPHRRGEKGDTENLPPFVKLEEKKKKRFACSFWVLEREKHTVEGSWLTGVCSLLEPISFSQLEREPRIQKCHKDKILVV